MQQKIITFTATLMLCACAQTDVDQAHKQAPQIAEAPAGQTSAKSDHQRSDQAAADYAAPVPQVKPKSLAMPSRQLSATVQQQYQAVRERHIGLPSKPQTPHSHVPGRENYAHWVENRFQQASLSPLSTFSLDVDTASYSNVRRFLSQGQLPPQDAVRIEELLNYFDYDFDQARGEDPLQIVTELGAAPWNSDNKLALIGIQARDLDATARSANRLVFLIDTSGSMNSPGKLPLLKRSFQILVEQMRPQDSVAIVTYAGSAGLVLPATNGNNKEAIYAALNRLRAGGSTAGAQGLQLAYQVAQQQFQSRANNRVILATDGDFNVGPSSEGELVRMIEKQRDGGVFLSILGFGSGNYQDAKMQKLAGHGNGTHHYIDTDREADRVFRDKLQGTLYTVAKDVKLQIEWNPATVAKYRLIGYESRMLQAEDFADDRKDAGDVGAGHSVTALYEIVPAGQGDGGSKLRYQHKQDAKARSNELGLVKLRYKQPQGQVSAKLEQLITRDTRAGNNLNWAAAVAEWGMLLRDSQYRGQASFDAILSRSQPLAGDDALRREFVALVRQAKVAAQSQVGQLNPQEPIYPR